MNFCLNKPVSLEYIKTPKFKKDDAEKEENYIQCLNKGEYFGMQPRFSKDYTRLAYIASSNKFLSHSGNYELKSINWPFTSESDTQTVLDYKEEYPTDDGHYAGLFGYQMTYVNCGFIGTSNRYYLIQSEFKGQSRQYIVDIQNKNKVRWINFLNKEKDHYRQGEYGLLKLQGNVAIVKYNSCNEPSRVYAVFFENIDGELDDIKIDSVLLHENVLHSAELNDDVKSITKEYVKLENGAEGYFVRLSDDKLKESPARGENGKHPMITIIHGGPFSASPQDMFLIQRNFLVLQGYCLFVVNYRGTIGFGKTFMDSLLGNIGSVDVEDCGNLTKAAIKQFGDIVDEKRVCVEGGSHGGFMTGWLIGHPEFKDLWAAAGIWNGVLDMSYMVASTDIPDWIFACCQNKELQNFGEYTVEDTKEFFLKSPIS